MSSEAGKKTKITAANREAWNQTAAYHRKATWKELVERMRNPTFLNLDAATRAALEAQDPRGKDAIHLCCNNGRETLSVKRMGARRCVGVDISDAFIAQAHELSAEANTECEFLRCEIATLPSEYREAFDLALVTVGVLGWMPDLSEFARAATSVLRPGGVLLLHEMHPVLDMFSPNPDDGTRIVESYFRTEPFVESSGIDYFGKETYESAASYWFHHTLGNIVTAFIEAGLEIRRLEEFPDDISATYAHLEKREERPPLSFLLVARKS